MQCFLISKESVYTLPRVQDESSAFSMIVQEIKYLNISRIPTELHVFCTYWAEICYKTLKQAVAGIRQFVTMTSRFTLSANQNTEQ